MTAEGARGGQGIQRSVRVRGINDREGGGVGSAGGAVIKGVLCPRFQKLGTTGGWVSRRFCEAEKAGPTKRNAMQTVDPLVRYLVCIGGSRPLQATSPNRSAVPRVSDVLMEIGRAAFAESGPTSLTCWATVRPSDGAKCSMKCDLFCC